MATQTENLDPNAPTTGVERVKRSPVVQRHITIKDRKDTTETVVVKKITRDYEVIDVDGFVFSRKRKSSTSSKPKSHKQSKVLENQAELQATVPASSSTPAASDGPQAAGQPQAADSKQAPHAAEATEGLDVTVDEADTQAMPSEKNGPDNSSHTSAHTPASGLGDGLAGEQEPIARSVFADEKEASEDERAIAERLLAQLPTNISEAERLMALCHLLAEEGVAALAQDPSATAQAAAEHVRSMMAAFAQGVSEALANGTLLPSEPVPEDSAMAEMEAERAAARAALEAHLQALQQEEQEWLEVMKDSKALSSDSAATDPAIETEVTSLEPATHTHAVGLLQQARADAHRKLTFQVEGLCAMVTGVEKLVETAEKQCNVMQAEYHKAKFRAYTHVNSPARLIRDIVRPRCANPL